MSEEAGTCDCHISMGDIILMVIKEDKIKCKLKGLMTRFVKQK